MGGGRDEVELSSRRLFRQLDVQYEERKRCGRWLFFYFMNVISVSTDCNYCVNLHWSTRPDGTCTSLPSDFINTLPQQFVHAMTNKLQNKLVMK